MDEITIIKTIEIFIRIEIKKIKKVKEIKSQQKK